MTIQVLDKDGVTRTIMTIDDLAAIVGAVGSSPAANTVQDRLKQIHTDIATTLAGYVDGLETLVGATNTSSASILAKLSSDPSTATGVAALGTKLDSLVSGMGAPGAQLSSASTSVVPATDGAPFRMSQDTSVLLNGNTALTPKVAKIAISATGDIVAAVTGKKIRVLAAKLSVAGAVNTKWTGGSGPTDLTGLSYFGAAGDKETLPFNPLGWFETTAGDKLSLNLSTGVAVGGHITYVEV